MKKRQQQKGYEKKMRYVGVSRWNICQQVASALYHSSLDDVELEKNARELFDELNNKNTKK